jgi:HlyD family secretion protein
MSDMSGRAAEQPRALMQRVAGHWEESPADTARKVLPAAISFQSDLDEIIEELPPRHMRQTAYLVGVLFIVVLAIASIAPVEVVVQGTGQLATDAPPIVLQPMERAIIRELKVKPGDVVRKGQVLASLDPTFAEADMASLTAQEGALKAQIARIEAELSGAPLTLKLEPDSNEAMQESLYRQRQGQYASRIKAYDEEIGQAEAAIATIEGNRNFLTQQLAITRDVEDMRSGLWKDKLTSKIQFLEAQSLRLRAERDLQDANDRLTELSHSASSKRAERQAFIEDWRRQLTEDLVAKHTDLAKLTESIAKANRLLYLVKLIAPEDGVVLDVAKRSVGSVMREAEPLITLVPSGVPLIAEVMLSSADVGYTQIGNPVMVKVDAFPYQRHGMLQGQLASISEASFSSQSGGDPPRAGPSGRGGAFHLARVALVNTTLERVPEGARLIPGMTVSADIKVGSRSVMSYFLTPVTRGLDESMREP